MSEMYTVNGAIDGKRYTVKRFFCTQVYNLSNSRQNYYKVMRKKDLQSKNAGGQAEIFVCASYTGQEIVCI